MPPSARDELFAYEITDPVLSGVVAAAWERVAASPAVAALDELNLCVINPAVASPGLMASPYFTAGCQALAGEKLIVINEEFLRGLEVAVRSFAQAESLLGSQYLKSDQQLFSLVRRAQTDQERWLERLRKQTLRAPVDPDAEGWLREELTMVVLFFLGHELGHLLGGHPTGQFAAFIDPNAPLPQRTEDAVVKLCRHVDEFAPTQFGLPGFEQVADKGSQVRREAALLRAGDEGRYERQEAFFANEAKADEWANRVIIDYLRTVAQRSEVDAERALYLLSRGVFVASLYTWYRDLDIFGGKFVVDSLHSVQDLYVLMMQGRERYVYASALFGDYHRFTLLRGAHALEEILRARSGWFDLPKEKRSIWCPHEAGEVATDEKARRAWWLSESLQRYFLLCICMDTAVKIATVGCATGWMLKQDRERVTPQLLVVNYESIDQAVNRLKKFG